MKNLLKTPLFYLILLLLLAPFSLIFYEMLSLNKNEQMLKRIYDNQLEAILFSVNQHTEDMISNWAAKTETVYNNPGNDSLILKEFIATNHSIKALFFISDNNLKLVKDTATVLNNHVIEDIRRSLAAKQSEINRLITYYDENYRKIEPITIGTPPATAVYFIIRNERLSQPVVAGMLIDFDVFVNEVLSVKLQIISQQEINLLVLKENPNQTIYSTPGDNVSAPDLTKPIWLFTNYSLGISQKGTSVAAMVSARKRNNLIVIMLSSSLFFISLVFTVLAIRKQALLAKIKSDFVSNVSHEIRTPLALIRMYAESLELDRVKEEKRKSYYSIIRQESERLSHLVNKILNFSKADQGKKTYNLEKAYVPDVIENVLKSYQSRLESGGFKWNYKVQENIPEIIADKEAVEEAFINLLDNAIKYSDQDKQVEIEIKHEKNSVEIIIKDHGIGISVTDQKFIFDKFYRVTQNHLANKVKGTGLGLSIVKDIMDAHKGSASVISKYGEGSEFVLTFPVN